MKVKLHIVECYYNCLDILYKYPKDMYVNTFARNFNKKIKS